MNRISRQIKVVLVSLMMGVVLSGCATIGVYNTLALQQLTSLKAFHMGVIDNNSQDGSAAKQYDISKVQVAKEAGELKFNEAVEYARAFKDKLRVDNIVLLKEVFEDDIGLIQKKNRLLTGPEAQVMRSATGLAYDEAIKGENARNRIGQ